MRIISQNGKSDIPYELFVFGLTQDNCIVAIRDTIARPSEMENGLVAKYSTEEKALKAMEMLIEHHETVSFLKTIINTEEGKTIVNRLSDATFNKMTQNYFLFPKDDEVE